MPQQLTASSDLASLRRSLKQDIRYRHRCAGFTITVRAHQHEGATRPVAVVRQGNRVLRSYMAAPIPGCPGWTGRADALFHARRLAYALRATLDAAPQAPR